MEIKQAFVGGKLMDVVSQDEYVRRVSMHEPELVQNTCIQANGTLYPVIRHPDNRKTPYALYSDIAIKYVGSCENNPGYSDKKVIDYSDISSNKELIEKNNQLRAEEVAILTQQSDKVFMPIIREEENPALKVVKECFHKKHIDIDNYRGRFDSNCDFANTIRLLTNPNNHNISVPKIQLIGEKFDINFSLMAKDKNDAVNPMGTSIEKEL